MITGLNELKCRKVVAGASIVVTSAEFNPAMFSRELLKKVGIMEEMGEGSVLTSGVVNIVTADYVLLILSNRIQMSLVAPTSSLLASEYFMRVMGGMMQH